jgi:uncharacterized membrane protein (GlpM family)
MVGELVTRFVIGGAFVALFALLGDLFEPKTFGGLFGAAPSVALATLALTIHAHGTAYAATEARSMIFGAVAFLAYASAVSWFLHRRRARVAPVVLAALSVWFVVGAVGWALAVRGR